MRLIDADDFVEKLKDYEAIGGHKHFRQGANNMLNDVFPDIINDQPTVNAVVLPCKVGDTVWVVFSNGIRPYVVDRIYIMGNSEIMVRMRFMLNEILRLTGDNFGKTVFLTREEAEAALAKMGGDSK